MPSFTEVSRQLHLLNDIILSDIRNGFGNAIEEETVIFSRHLFATKHWFSRISSSNKKIFILALLKHLNSAWAISLLLKAIWNCRPKDAVSSVCEKEIWSSYDQDPLDHNRTAVPLKTLVLVMKSDREWFISLEPDQQAVVLTELVSIGGGPLMWTVLQEAQIIYEKYREDQLVNIQECMVVTEPPIEKVKSQAAIDKGKKEPTPRGRPSSAGADSDAKQNVPGQAQKELDLKLAQWQSIIKIMKDSLKLEELEMTFTDGTKKKIWKVNRPIPEVIETVDFLQLLPSAIGKRILSFLPNTFLVDCARVNKYWAYLVDDLKAEAAARLKIDADMEKLKDLVLRHDTSMNTMDGTEQTFAINSQMASTAPSMMYERPSLRPSEKSGRCSFRNLQPKKSNKKPTIPPIRNMADMSERLNRRGATDDNLWGWCSAILKRHVIKEKSSPSIRVDGVMSLGNQHFPCPLMKYSIQLPLNPPLEQDPTTTILHLSFIFIYIYIIHNMPVSAFAEVTKQVHVLNDLILDDMIYAREQNEIETLQFNKHLSALKNWFTRISTPNKKRFLLALIEDISSAWALSLILMSIWNCRTKDAIMIKVDRPIVRLLVPRLRFSLKANLSDYARVNKYWAYLVEELRSERAARVKINADLEKLQDLMFINDTSMENFETFEFKVMAPSIQATSLGPSVKIRAQQLPSTKTSMKSAGAYSFRRFVTDSMYVPEPIFQIPIRNLNQMKDRLDNRGALDENVWTWCETILNRRRSRKDSSTSNEKETDGILLLSNLHFPCPLMTHTLKLPLNPPLVKDHTARYTSIKMK
ncbi:hypothetical protein MSG28_004234 [Choristoneura fumiferana]|uniref:Uncharacterized protein n=2 Tax=Choristoneura fumiferana TaxID=7141 RepID=A0ACC0KI45_CHOFU|nr:hypothetical protein MSG28_004234 [Choristoneura fumiferana]